MKTNCPTQPRPGQCCGARPKPAAADGGGGPTREPRRAVEWTDGLRPFLGFYVFKG